MQIIAADIEDVKIIEPQIFKDDRGYFLESYHLNRFKNVPIFMTPMMKAACCGRIQPSG